MHKYYQKAVVGIDTCNCNGALLSSFSYLINSSFRYFQLSSVFKIYRFNKCTVQIFFKCNGALLSSVSYLINSTFRYFQRFLTSKCIASINVTVQRLFKSNGALLASVSYLINSSFRYFQRSLFFKTYRFDKFMILKVMERLSHRYFICSEFIKKTFQALQR